MKRKRFTAEQFIAILERADSGLDIADIVRERRNPASSVRPSRTQSYLEARKPGRASSRRR